MVKFELLSPNLLVILNQIIQNQNIAKYLYYDVTNPLEQPDIADTSVLNFNKVFPYPFDPELTTEDCSQIRVFYWDGAIKRVIEETKVMFDIIVAKKLWLINDNNTPAIRPYQIMSELVTTLDDKSIESVGRLHFNNFRHVSVDQQFDAIRVLASMTTFNQGSGS